MHDIHARHQLSAPNSGAVFVKYLLISLIVGYISAAAFSFPERFVTLFFLYSLDTLPPFFCIFFIFFAFISLRRKGKHPFRTLLEVIHERSVIALSSMALLTGGLAAFTTFKIAIPELVPFYADRWLSGFDLWLHGEYPWKTAHRLVPPALAWLVDLNYNVIFHGLWLSVVVYACLTVDTRRSMRFLAALFLAFVLLGNVLATFLSSAGPIYYDYFHGSHQYAGLNAIIDSGGGLALVKSYSSYLLASYQNGTPEIGSGISAAPSIHVAVAMLTAFFLSSINRWLGAVAWPFVVIMQFGSVYTGWHYAIDGYISIIASCLIWWVTGRLISQTEPNYSPQAQPGVDQGQAASIS